jgi:hypothetical protein
LALEGLTVEFGKRFAEGYDDAQQGKYGEGEQNGKENLEEGEEDRSDQAVAATGPASGSSDR